DRAREADAAAARGHARGRRRGGRVPLLAGRELHHRPRARGRWRSVGLISQEPKMDAAAPGVALYGAKLPPISLTTNCPSCGVGLVPEELREQVYVCDCGHHFRMHAEAWIALLADEGSWRERWAD